MSATASLAARLSEYRVVARSLLDNPIVLGMSAVSGLRTAAQSSLSAFVPLYLTFAYAMGPDQVSFYLTALFSLGIISPLIGGSLSDRIGRRPVLLFGLFVSGVLVLALPMLAPGPLLLAFLAATGLFLYALRSVIIAHALDVSAAAGAASTVGLIFGVQGVVAGLAPAVLGALADAAGPAAAVGAAGVLVLAAGCVVLALPTRAPVSAIGAQPVTRAGA
jgi:sugar phosphate permease